LDLPSLDGVGSQAAGDLTQRAITAIVDTLGTMAAGVVEEPGELVLRHVLGSRTERFLPWTGVSADVAPEELALISSTLCHAMDFDDVLPGAGHPSAPVLSSLLAIVATRPVSGVQVIE